MLHANQRVYLDNAATTPLCEAAVRAMAPYMQEGCAAPFGNANSVHTVGRTAFSALEDARVRAARALGASRPDEVVFTSGATEANNAALIGIARAAREKQRLKGNHQANRVIMSRVEHESVLEAASLLEALGFSVAFVENDAQARVTPEALRAALDERTVLVSVMAANNEVGTVQPVAELARVAHEAGVLFHTDATQALGKIAVDVRAWGADAASFSAHKVCGPKGVGMLWLKNATPFMPFLAGGGQERGLRSGTQNVMGIAGCVAAVCEAVAQQEAFARRVRAMRDELYAALAAMPRVIPTVQVSPGSCDFLPHIVNVCVRGIESQTAILQLDLRGVCISGGSACASSSLDPSHVLSALGVARNVAQGELRVSFGPQNTPADMQAFLEAFSEVVA